jgi:transcriptional regulator with XRE-family HTH domain
LLLRYRGRTGLTQRALAARIGVHVRSIQAWETGISYPRAEHLQALLAAFLQTGGLAEGAEVAEAGALWAAAVRQAPRLRTSFDQDRFVAFLAERDRPAGRRASAPYAVRTGVKRPRWPGSVAARRSLRS